MDVDAEEELAAAVARLVVNNCIVDIAVGEGIIAAAVKKAEFWFDGGILFCF